MENTDNKPYTRERAWEKGSDYIDLSTCSYMYDQRTDTGYNRLTVDAWIVDSSINKWNQRIIPKNDNTGFNELINSIEVFTSENGFKEVDVSQ